jgi:ribonuclease HI
MANKQKFYVVWEGKETGIFETWDACKESIHGHSQAKYKSFKTLEEARKAFSEPYENYKGKNVFKVELSKDELEEIGKPNLDSVSVDAACNGATGEMEYQAVDTRTKKVLFIKGPFFDASNNIGEFLALVHALALLKKNGDKRPVYSDSKIAINWVNQKTQRSKVEPSKYNTNVFEFLHRALKWLKTNDYDNVVLKWETKAWGEIPADFGRK